MPADVTEPELTVGREPTPEAALTADDLLGHVAVLGRDGCGKTTMLRVVAERAAAAGIPVVALDGDGDLLALLRFVDGGDLPMDPLPWTPGNSNGLPLALAPLAMPLPEPGPDRVRGISLLVRALVELADYAAGSKDARFAASALELVLTDCFDRGLRPSGLDDLARCLRRPPKAIATSLTEVLPADDVVELARRLTTLAVGSRRLLFTHGLPLDAATLLGRAVPPTEGRTRVSIVSPSGLGSDVERTYLLSEVLRAIFLDAARTGAHALRTLVLFDGADGFCTRGAKSSVRDAFETLLTQGPRLGIGVVFSADAPEALAPRLLDRARTWFLGASETLPEPVRAESQDPEGLLVTLRAQKPGNFLRTGPRAEAAPRPISIRSSATREEAPSDRDLVGCVSKEVRDAVRARTDELLRSLPSTPVARQRAGDPATVEDAQIAAGLAEGDVENDDATTRQSNVLAHLRSVKAVQTRTDVADALGFSPRMAAAALEALVEGKLAKKIVRGTTLEYFPAESHHHPSVGLIETLLLAPTRRSWNECIEAAESQVDRSLFVRKQEEVAEDPATLIHFPLWQCRFTGFKTRGVLFKKLMQRSETIYVHPTVPDICLLTRGGGFRFHTHLDETNPLDVKDLDDITHLEQGAARDVTFAEEALDNLMTEKELRQHFRGKFDLPIDEAHLIFLPLWRFLLRAKKGRGTRTVLVDAVTGNPFRPFPEPD